MYLQKIKAANRKHRWTAAVFVVLIAVSLAAGWRALSTSAAARKKAEAVAASELRPMKPAELKAYDGTRPGQPIYLGFEGLVYDVTAGKKYYQAGGSYHFLAGRDSTADLKVVGGDIIKKKYPVVARLVK